MVSTTVEDTLTTSPQSISTSMGHLSVAAADPEPRQHDGRCKLELEDLQKVLSERAVGSKEDADTEHTEPPSSCDDSHEFPLLDEPRSPSSSSAVVDPEQVSDDEDLGLDLARPEPVVIDVDELADELDGELNATAEEANVRPMAEPVSLAAEDEEEKTTTDVPMSEAGTTARSRRVSFTKVEIREFPRCLGDHPCVLEGPPLSIGWKFSERYVLDLDDYEESREQDIRSSAASVIAKAEARKAEALGEDKIDVEELTRILAEKMKRRPTKRRTPLEYQISVRKRIEILQEECSRRNAEAEANGTVCSGAEIKARIREMQKIKIQRIRSAYMTEFESVQMVAETAQRKLKKTWQKMSKSKATANREKQMLLAACGSYIEESAKHSAPKRRRFSLKAVKAPRDNIDGF